MPTRQFAAIDLGSNSFHMVLARVTASDQIQIIDRDKEYVRLGGGLDADRNLTPEVLQAAYACLSRFSDRLEALPPEHVRCVGTNALRQAKNAHLLLEQGASILGHPIEVIAGLEEARLIYEGAGLEVNQPGKRLIVDIGGGSTELILGDEIQAQALDSLYMGCVSWTQRFFPNGKVTAKRMEKAILAARRRLAHVMRRYRGQFQHAWGCSGTINALGRLTSQLASGKGAITETALMEVAARLIDTGSAKASVEPDISPQRAEVLPGGLAILTAVMHTLRIPIISPVGTALREGIVVDMLGRDSKADARERTVADLQRRFGVDTAQSERVEQLAGNLFHQVADPWQLHRTPHALLYLQWAARLHEVGLFLRFRGYHKHGAYLLANGNLVGFSIQDQKALAALVLCHRGRFTRERLASFQLAHAVPTKLVILLRVSARLHRRRSPKPLPAIVATATDNELHLRFPEGWLQSRPLTLADLDAEQQRCQEVGVNLAFE